MFHKLGNIHNTFKIMFFLLQPNCPLWRRGCVTYPLSSVASSWLVFLYFVFIGLDLSTRNFAFVFFVLEFLNFLKQHYFHVFEIVTSLF
jgi:hypothetical protein